MTQTEQTKVRVRQMRKRLVVSVIVNGIIPISFYIMLRQIVGNDLNALAIAGAIPAARTIMLWLWRRQVDWIGALAVLSFMLALGISYLSGGSALALELRGSILMGMVGLACLISLVVGKPLVLGLVKLSAQNSSELSRIFESEDSNQLGRQRLTTLTTVIGCVLVGKTVVDVVLALALPTTTFLAVSRVVNWAILGSGLAFIWLTRRSVGDQVRDHH